MNKKLRTVDIKTLRNVTGGAGASNWSTDSWKGSNWNAAWNTGNGGSQSWWKA